jgi:hypothetical protein
MTGEPLPAGELCLRCRAELHSLGETGTMRVELLACPHCRRLEQRLLQRG